MKTLDEVIKANECCDHCEPDSNCKECPYISVPACALERETDALHYLKVFQRHEERVRGQLDDLKEEYRPNDPLTWDELKTMEGKPVWVEIFYPVMEDETGATEDEGKWEGYWALRTHRKHEFLIVEKQREPLYEEDYGKSWKAYRKER